MFGLVIYCIIVGGLVVALWRYPSIALAGVLCMFGLEQWGQASHPFFLQHQEFTNIMVGTILLLGLTFKALKGDLLVANYPMVGWLVFGLFIYAFASAIWAPRPDISLNLWISRGPYVLTIIVLAPLLLSSRDELKPLFQALIVTGSLLVLLLLFFAPWESRMIVLGEERGNPLEVSALGGMVALAVILTNPWPASKIWGGIKWPILALCLFLVIRSGSRGQLLALIGLAAVCWPMSRRVGNIRQIAVWLGAIIFMSGVTAWALQEFWAEQENYYAGGNRWSEQAMQGAMSGRFDDALYLVQLWFASVKTIVFGLGNSASFDPRILGIYPHFMPLEILAEEGLIGFGLFVVILYGTTHSAVQYYRLVQADSVARSYFAVLVAMFIYTLVLSLKQGSLLGNLQVFMFAIILAKCAGLIGSAEAPVAVPESLEVPSDEVVHRYPILR